MVDPIHPETGQSEELDRILADLVANRGGVANVFAALSASPGVLAAVASVGTFLRQRSSLSPVTREAAVLATASEANCVYEWSHHWAVAEQIDESRRIREALADDRGESELAVAVRATRALLRNERQAEAYDSARQLFGLAGLAELVVLVGYYHLLSLVVVGLDVQLEEGVAPVPFD